MTRQEFTAAVRAVQAGEPGATLKLWEGAWLHAFGILEHVTSRCPDTGFLREPGFESEPQHRKKAAVLPLRVDEARVLAWFSGEQWRLDTFQQGGDIYCASARGSPADYSTKGQSLPELPVAHAFPFLRTRKKPVGVSAQ